ncbi:MAG: gliding motility-associated C-terminal domain-containing protein, partial [bacterium]
EFDSVGLSLTNTFTDRGLVDGEEYCYYVKTIGKYSSGGFKEPLINLSQEYCAEPKDTNRPCPPLLSVDSTCTDFTNELTWLIDAICSGDVVKYKIYKSTFEGSEFELITEINSKDILEYNDVDLFTSRAGCYFISSVDSFGNESTRSNVVCVDNCPQLNLPNVFTPNGDNKNDLFEPKSDENKFIDKVTITIYNRYGREVYQTNNSKIQWDGKDQNNGQELPAGVYFYTIEFSEIRVKGLSPKIKTGFVHLIR